MINIASIMLFIGILVLIYLTDYRPHIQSASFTVKALYTSLIAIGALASILYMLHIPGFVLHLH
ncbi:hypothetical protein C7445_10341 [Alicyclobacillus sacchari]|uniref:DUF1146 domain-containing protein n=1 Tax=Alicyclobacillus sacchari TaxID=392010 RepID=A0A4R8LRB1_9BACL|nr:hypothetical protein [Alicyclobacillus sacchari]TDY49998.1 hypothetical protein C7445_10341 [Alicyclobacillus sacchari]GMA57687.1 hypothetical protein GCM10025858_21900 [Alicyclobacillus sacchari]